MLRIGLGSGRLWLAALAVALSHSVGLAADEPSVRGGLLNRLLGRNGHASKAESGGRRAESRKVEPIAEPSSVTQQASATSPGPSPRTVQPVSGPQPSTPARRDSEALNPQPSSLTLEYLERLARENNPTLAQAAAVIEAARGRQIQAGLGPNPTVGYTGSEIGNDGRGGQQGIVFGQEIVRGGKLMLSSAVSGYEREQAEAQAAAQMFRVLTSVRSLFYDTLAAEQTLALTRELTKLAEQGVSVAQQREKAGEGTLTETLQAQIELEQVRILEANSSNNYRASWKRLAAIVGRPEKDPVPLVGSLQSPREEREETATLARLTGQSPEIQIAEAGIRRADMAVARARVEPVSNVTLEAGTEYDFASNNQIASVGVRFPIPIRNRNQGNILAAESELVRSRRELDRVKLSLAERFAAAYARYQNAQNQVERFGTRLPDAEIKRLLGLVGEERQKELEQHPQILPRAQLALALATEGWQRGEFGYLQVLTAQRTLTQATLGSVGAIADLRQSIVAIDGYLLTDAVGGAVGSPGSGPAGAGE